MGITTHAFGSLFAVPHTSLVCDHLG